MRNRCWPRRHKRNLVEADKPKRVSGFSDEQIALMEREFVNLEREFKIAEKSYGTDHLDLVLTNGYLGKLLGNARVVRYLAQHHTTSCRIPEACRDGSCCGLTARGTGAASMLAVDGDPDPISAGTAGEAALWGGSSAVVGMAANPSGAHQVGHHMPTGWPLDRARPLSRGGVSARHMRKSKGAGTPRLAIVSPSTHATCSAQVRITSDYVQLKAAL